VCVRVRVRVRACVRVGGCGCGWVSMWGGRGESEWVLALFLCCVFGGVDLRFVPVLSVGSGEGT